MTQSSVHARPGKLAPIPEELHPKVRSALRAKGIDSLWSHQAEALDAAWAGPTIVTTGTASGKSLCFQLPTLDVLCRDARARALYLYPTKALAQDQARALHALGRQERAARDLRRRHAARAARGDPAQQQPHPHQPRHAAPRDPAQPPAWANFFANLAIVVVDEAHVYRGVFGSHVANVLRRLRRIAGAYGTAPRFLLASATIANPGELAERLTGLDDVTLIDRDGSPVAAHDRDVEPADHRREDRHAPLARWPRRPSCSPSSSPRARGRSCFMKSRKAVELIAKLRADELEDRGHAELAERIAPYRAGYTPQQRRELERGSSRASCSASSRPTRSSSASTSARSTRRSA